MQTFTFKKVVRNGAVSPATFQATPVPGWMVVEFEDPSPKPITSRAGRPLPPPIHSQPAATAAGR